MKLRLEQLPVKNRRVLMRVDFNVPIDEHGHIVDDSRIRAALPSIRWVLDKGAQLILMSHLGRPDGKFDSSLSLRPIARHLESLLNHPVLFASDCVGPDVLQLISSQTAPSIILLENLRFHIGEEFPDREVDFVHQLKCLGDCYVSEAFGSAHRAHASTVNLPLQFPKNAAMGFLMEKEIQVLSSLLTSPKRPFYLMIGGAKVSSKVGVIQNLLPRIDALLIGGKMAFPFLAARGFAIESSHLDESECKHAKEILDWVEKHKILLYLPSDIVAEHDGVISNSCTSLPKGWTGKDIGKKTISAWTKALSNAQTIFWNGPLGVYEVAPFDQGTRAIAQALSSLSSIKIVGGGDSVAAIEKMGLAFAFTHLSTGGGATLEFLEKGHLPGIDALSER